MLTIFAAGFWDSPAMEWVMANWQWFFAAGVGWLGYSNRTWLLSKFKAAPGPAPEPTEGDNRAALSAALCLVSDHCQALEDKAGIEACKILAPLVMLMPE